MKKWGIRQIREALRLKHPHIRGFLETSCDDLTGIPEARATIVCERPESEPDANSITHESALCAFPVDSSRYNSTLMPTTPNITQALEVIEAFIASDLTARIAELESSVKGCDGAGCASHSVNAGVTSDLLSAAYAVKRVAGQVNVLIHAVGGLLLLPQILESGEKIEYVSLGAGNSGRAFDLETDRRVAEFKFIHWRGADTIRQNSLFKDFYMLAEHQTKKRKELFVLDTTLPLKFLRGRRALRSVFSKNVKHWEEFQAKYGHTYETVGNYYAARQQDVTLRDAAPLVPQLLRIVDAAPRDVEWMAAGFGKLRQDNPSACFRTSIDSALVFPV